MKKQDDSFQSLKSHLAESIEQLQNGFELSVDECDLMIEEIESAKVIAIEDEILPQPEEKPVMSIEELISGFNETAEDSTQLLQEMLTIISEGRAPAKDNIAALDNSILSLQKSYSNISEYVAARIGVDEMPEDGSPVSAYREALENSSVILYQKQLDEARQKLKTFISVRSLIDAYASALRPYQEKAESLLLRLESNEIVEVEELGAETGGPGAFLDVLECEDLDSDESIEKLDAAAEFFSTRVNQGLSASKYYIDWDALNNRETPQIASIKVQEESQDSRQSTEEDKSDKGGAAEEKEVATEDDECAERIIIAQELNSDSSSESNTTEGEQKPEKSDFVALEYQGALIVQDDIPGFFIKDISSSEEKKISANVFKNDVRKGSVQAAKDIFENVCRINCVIPEYIALKGAPIEIVRRTMYELQKKGYLREFGLNPGGKFYSASPRFIKAITYKEASKFVGVRQRAADDWGQNVDDRKTSAAARITFINLLTEVVLQFRSTLNVATYTESSMTFTDAFCFRVFDKFSKKHCVFSVGAFWDDNKDCDEDLDNIKNLYGTCEGISNLIVAGVDVERARNLANVLIEVLNIDVSDVTVALYSLSGTFYAFESLREIKPEEALSYEEVKPDTDEEETISEDEPLNETVTQPLVNSEKAIPSEDIEQREAPVDHIEKEIVGIQEEKSTVPQKETSPDAGITTKKVTHLVDESPEDVKGTVYKMLSDGHFYAAAAYAKACASFDENYQRLYELIAYAVNDPMAHNIYSTENAFNLIARRSSFDDAMVLATAIRTFFSNQVRYDYQIKPFYDGIKEYPILSRYPTLSNVLYTLMEFKDKYKKGLDAYADYRAKSQAQLESEIEKTRHEADMFYENYVVGKKKENASQKRFLETKKLMFAVNSDFGAYIKSIVDNDRDPETVQLIVDFLKLNFLKEDGQLSEDSINSDKLWDYIVGYWEKAGESMMYKRHADLMSRLRGNITSVTMKAVQLLIDWCALLDQASNHTEDVGTAAYRRKRTPLLNDLAKAIEEINTDIGSSAMPVEEKAGLRGLVAALDEIQRCISGSFDEKEHRYFYVPFLLSDDVMLDENYYPDLEAHNASLRALQPHRRIEEHLRKTTESNKTYLDRITEILEDKGDDYGIATLILDYLVDVNTVEDAHSVEEAIETGVNYAREAADIRKDDFIGELELAQSYGQIDNSTEDKKEKILQIVDEWHEWAVDTSNYGFFRKVMEGYLAEIREEAKDREKDLQEQLEVFRTTQISGLSTEAKEKRVNRIREMIREQNYTVAEDLLARATISEDEHEEIIEEDFLREFLDNYDVYYKQVATRKANFSSLVSSHTRNKEERGAKKMADNWLPGGSKLGRDRLAILLTCLGFKPATIKDQSSTGKYETYTVVTEAAKVGRDNYTHPIAIFGSGASQDGFRVVCINGGFDADGLIDVMKQLGNAKHTLILHDYALSLSERRRLARKSKNALGDKFFGVIDRTVMMYLVRNYDENRINRMLISLIMPFGYYQPYVWESVNVMPPEIFMGRKHELERIKSPTGVNIVYGGRQLGKSALLKKAKEDIDWDENGDRAVYIDIKGLDYSEAAQKIGHELYDQFILPEDIDTTDWGELSRVIRRRLQDQTKKIPYLLLLLDEADTFIESCEVVNYKPLDALKDIQNIGANRFKFVIAGLRNVVRFKREAALGNNSVLTHLEPMTVKPFNTSEARELMEIPLHYLGLHFSKEKESLVTLILANTNYFPGLIQMYCAKLLEAMRNKDYAGYDEVNTPIYEVSEEHIKKVLADPEFMQQIREKYTITLRLDEDNYYYLIALIMAYLYHRNGYNEGYSAEDVHNAGKELDINKIADLSIVKLSAFMEELRELNVLRNTDEAHYLFTRFTFFQMMGTSTEVEDKLVEYMEA